MCTKKIPCGLCVFFCVCPSVLVQNLKTAVYIPNERAEKSEIFPGIPLPSLLGSCTPKDVGLGLSPTTAAATETIQICCDFPFPRARPFLRRTVPSAGFPSNRLHLHRKGLNRYKCFLGPRQPARRETHRPAGSGFGLGGGWCSRRSHFPPGPPPAARWACAGACARGFGGEIFTGSS